MSDKILRPADHVCPGKDFACTHVLIARWDDFGIQILDEETEGSLGT